MKNETETKSNPKATQNNNAPKKLKIKTSVQAPTEEPATPCRTGHIV